MKLKRLGHVAICVQDIDLSAEFYQNLGMELVWKDADWAYLKAGDDGLALLSPGYDQAGPHFGFVFSDRAEMEAAYDRLKASGVKVTRIHEHRDGPLLSTVATSTGTGLSIFTNQQKLTS